MKYTINRNEKPVATVRPEGQLSTQIMGEELVTMDFVLPQMVNFLINDTVEVYGNTYYLLNEPKVVEVSTIEYHYSLTFVGVKYNLAKVQFFYPDNANELTVSDFSAIIDANTAIDLVVQNANRTQSGWAKGVVVETTPTQLDFSGDNCLSALAKIAEAFKLEYWVDGDQSIHIEERKQISGYTLQYGQARGLKQITRTPLDNSNIVTRLYAKGSDKNIPGDYRNYSQYLKMPVPYLEKNTEKYGIVEHVQTFDDIFPKRIGKVTAIDANEPCVFTDADLDFDLNEVDANGTVILIDGISAKVKFQSGQLAGYTFEVQEKGFNSSTKTFILLKNTNEKDVDVPSELLRPAIGDEYILFDVKMPQSYIDNAELELQKAAQKYLDENCEQRNQYKVIADPIYFCRQNVNVGIGQTVHFIDQAFGLDANLRVVSLKKDLQNPYDVDFELAERATLAQIVLNYIDNQASQTAIVQQLKYNAQKARRSYNFAREIHDNVFDQEGYFDPERIKPLSIETKMLTVGSRMQQINLPNILLQVSDDNKTVTNTAGKFIHLTLEDKPRGWDIAANSQTNIPDGFHYIYAKAQKVGTNANILVSSEQLEIESNPDFYHFEIGYLGSIEDGFRRIKTTYGFTQVSPGEIVTGRISSADGTQYIDLLEDRINFKGNVEFVAGSTAYNQIAQAQQGAIDKAQQSAEENAKNYTNTQTEALQNNVDDINSKLSSLESNINNAFSDGVISKSEAIAIEKYKNTLSAEKSDIDVQYAKIYNDVNLSGSAKTELENKKNTYDKTHSNLMSAIETAIVDGETTPLEKSNVDSKFGYYRTGLKWLRGAFEGAIKAIEDKKIADAKAYAKTQDELLKTHTEAYADGVLTKAEAHAISVAEAKSNLAKTQAQAYADGVLDDAEKFALESAKQTLENAQNYAKEQDALIQVGGRNLQINISSKINKSGGISDFVTEPHKVSATFDLTVDYTPYMFLTLIQHEAIKGGDEYTFRMRLTNESNVAGRVYFRYNGVNGDSYVDIAANSTVWFEKTLIANSDLKTGNRAVIGFVKDNTTSSIRLTVEELGLYKGNKATDWTPAPEDVQTEIDKSEAEAVSKAKNYTNTQTEALQNNVDDINSKLSNLESNINNAFSDGVISKSEAIAIEKYKNTLSAEKSDIDVQYAKIYNDVNLSGSAKTELENKKNTYDKTHSNLMSAIETAIVDGETTPLEKSNVDSKFGYYRTGLKWLRGAFEGAIKAIEDKKIADAKAYAKTQDELLKTHTEAYADGVLTKAEAHAISVAEAKSNLAKTQAQAYADGVLDDAEKFALESAKQTLENAQNYAKEQDALIQVGGRNLQINISSKINKSGGISDFVTEPHKVSATFDLTVDYTPYMFLTPIQHEAIKGGDEYTFRMRLTNESNVAGRVYFRYNGVNGDSYVDIAANSTVWFEKTLIANSDLKTGNRAVIGFVKDNTTSSIRLTVEELGLYKGNKATDWTPAPEDVQTEIDVVSQQTQTALAQAQAVEYLKTALGNNTTVEGGLLSSSIIKLGAMLDGGKWKENAGISGLNNDNIGAYFGGTYVEALQSLSKILLRKDGSGHLAGGKLRWGEDGNLTVDGVINTTEGYIGNFKIKNYGLHNEIGDENSAEQIHVSLESSGLYVSVRQQNDWFRSKISYQGISVAKDNYVSNTHESIEIKSDGIYKNGVKVI